MSTTDTRAAFEAWAVTCDGNCNDKDLRKYSAGHPNYAIDGADYISQLTERDWTVWQAATEAAKATGTAGELPIGRVVPCEDYGSTIKWVKSMPRIGTELYAMPVAGNVVAGNLPEPPESQADGDSTCDFHGRLFVYTLDDMREYGQQCAEAARHDKDGNHADDLRGMLDELQAEFDKQQSAFWACSEKLAQVQRNQETELSDIRILELAEEDFGEQDDRNVKNEALLSFARKVQAARQPAPVVVKPWETRMQEYFAQGSVKMRTPASFMADEIIDSRAALAATAAPVLSDEQIDHIARSYFAEEHGQTKAKGVIHDALVNARVLRPDHRETLEQIAHFLHNSVRIQQNAPDDYYPATEFDSQLQQAADEIGSILAATNRSQP